MYNSYGVGVFLIWVKNLHFYRLPTHTCLLQLGGSFCSISCPACSSPTCPASVTDGTSVLLLSSLCNDVRDTAKLHWRSEAPTPGQTRPLHLTLKTAAPKTLSVSSETLSEALESISGLPLPRYQDAIVPDSLGGPHTTRYCPSLSKWSLKGCGLCQLENVLAADDRNLSSGNAMPVY